MHLTQLGELDFSVFFNEKQCDRTDIFLLFMNQTEFHLVHTIKRKTVLIGLYSFQFERKERSIQEKTVRTNAKETQNGALLYRNPMFRSGSSDYAGVSRARIFRRGTRGREKKKC